MSGKKKVVLICGMHRSGTSALTGVLNILGLHLGTDMLPTQSDNIKGYFENKNIYNLNEYILNVKLNSVCNTILPLTIDLSRTDILELIEYVIITSFANKNVIGIKDPRICLLLPFYQRVFTKLGYEIYYIRAKRDELEVIKSLSKRNGFTEEKSKEIINRHVESLDKFLPCNYITVHFRDLLYNTEDVISVLQQALPFLDYNNVNKQKVNYFLDSNLKHH